MSDHLYPADKRRVIDSYGGPYECLVETGVYAGDCAALHLGFPETWVIDIDPGNCATVKDRVPAAMVVCGDSGEKMPEVLDLIPYPALFWLDAHYVGDTYDPPDILLKHPVPLLAELDAILAWPHAAGSTVLVDDVRLFGSPGWPRGSDVHHRLELWTVTQADDILRAVPR